MFAKRGDLYFNHTQKHAARRAVKVRPGNRFVGNRPPSSFQLASVVSYKRADPLIFALCWARREGRAALFRALFWAHGRGSLARWKRALRFFPERVLIFCPRVLYIRRGRVRRGDPTRHLGRARGRGRGRCRRRSVRGQRPLRAAFCVRKRAGEREREETPFARKGLTA